MNGLRTLFVVGVCLASGTVLAEQQVPQLVTAEGQVAATPTAGGSDVNLIMSEIVDGTLPGGQPKWVEITNCGGEAVDLAQYSIGNFNNGGTDLGGGASTVLMGMLAPGAGYIVSYEFTPSADPCVEDADCGNNQFCSDDGGGGGTSVTSMPNVPIPDGDAVGVSDTINMGMSFNILDLEVDLVINHTWIGDLCVTLSKDGGPPVTLIQRMNLAAGCDATGCCGCGSDDMDITLDDEAAGGLIDDACGAAGGLLTGTFVPDEPLANFVGGDSAGAWTLTVNDNAGADTGLLASWTLNFAQAGGGTCISVFEDVYGFAPNQFIGPFVNGDDVLALFEGPATGDGSDAIIVDQYGVIGVDGSGEPWEYTDSYANSNAGRAPNGGAFDPMNWDIPGANSLEDPGGDDAIERQNLLDNTSPGTHDCGAAGPCPGEGDCCDLAGNGSPGCNDEACCNEVCAVNPFCCDVFWDPFCAIQANDLCSDPFEVCDDCPLSGCEEGICCLTQTASDGDTGGSVACGVSGNGTTENGYARCFDLAGEGVVGDLIIDQVTFGVQQFDLFPGSPPDLTIQADVNLYIVPACSDPLPFDPGTLIATASTMLNVDSEATQIVVDFPGGVLIPAGSNLVVEIRNEQDGTDDPPFAFRVSTNQSETCGLAYIRAEDCGIGDWLSLVSIGFPGSNYVIEASGHQEGGGAVTCGDGIVEGCESCDGGEGCSAACQPEVCGNGYLDPGEECDDGNLENGDGCDDMCVIEPICGDGVINQPDEECDGLAGPCPGQCTSECICDCTCEPGTPPNDCSTDSIPISDGLTPFSTEGATTDGLAHPEQCLADGIGQTYADIWYDYEASCTGTLLVSTCAQNGGSSDYDTDIVVYEGCGLTDVCPPGADAVLGCNDDDNNNPCGGVTCSVDEDCNADIGEFCIGFCVSDCTASNCCVANGTPGCDNMACQDTVCAADPFCCNTEWDSICAGEAVDLCGDLCTGSGCPDGQICSIDLDGDGTADTCSPLWQSTVFVDVSAGDCYTVRVGGFGADTDQGTGEINIVCEASATEQTLIVKQGACPAPVNPNSNGVIPMALVGDVDFDVNDVVLESLDLHLCGGSDGIAPLNGPPGPPIQIVDVNHPFPDPISCEEGPCACNDDQSSDGIDDLWLKFSTNEFMAAIGDALTPGAVVVVELSGALTDGSLFFARDCLQIVPPGGSVPSNFAVDATAPRAYAFMSPWDMNLDSDGFADFVRAYPLGETVTLTADLTAPDGTLFDHWVVNGVTWRQGVTTITVEVTENMNLEAVYVGPQPADLNTPQGRSFGINR